MDNTLTVAYYVLSKYDNITPLKLQKLLYYLKAWGLVAGESLLDGKFKKWAHGPVNVDVYHEFKEYKGEAIALSKKHPAKTPFEGAEKAIADFILDCYAPYPAVTLSAMTHSEAPWIDTADNATISDKSMKNYYSKLAFANNFPLDFEKKPFYPVLTDNHYAFIFDMSAKDAASAQVYPSYKVYKAKQEAASEELQKLLKSLERK